MYPSNPATCKWFYRLDGKEYTASQLCSRPESIVHPRLFRHRMKSEHWTVEEALTTPPQRRVPPISAWGETKSVAEWARDPRCTVKEASLRSRLRRGMPPEEAISAPRLERRAQGDIPPDTLRRRRQRGADLYAPLRQSPRNKLREGAILEAIEAFEGESSPYLDLPEPPSKPTPAVVLSAWSIHRRLSVHAKAMCLSVSVFSLLLLQWWFGEDPYSPAAYAQSCRNSRTVRKARRVASIYISREERDALFHAAAQMGVPRSAVLEKAATSASVSGAKEKLRDFDPYTGRGQGFTFSFRLDLSFYRDLRQEARRLDLSLNLAFRLLLRNFLRL